MSVEQLKAGDQVFHPMYGFGVVEGMLTRDQAGQPADYYGVRLSAGGVLSVPVARADAVGLRRVVNGFKKIVACLHSPARPLPDNDRQRIVELKARWQSPQPGALAEAMRDLLARSRVRSLTPADKKWLANACDRLSDEAARVDAIEVAEARAMIQREMDHLKLH
jgi:RNA polymerase-interacting CarD/CdnL/TRCF family regulator